MKIAFVVEEFPKISETFVLNQATGLIDMGHEVDIFYFKIGDTKVMHSNIEKYGLLEKAICLNPLFTFPNRVKETYLAFDEEFSKMMGFKLPLLKAFRYIRSWASVILFLLIFQVSWSSGKRRKYDIIHCQFGTAGLRFLPFYRLRILGGKFIVQFRGHDVTEFVNQEGRSVYRKLFQDADYFLPVCEYLRKKALELGCPKDKILIMKSSVDLNHFEYLERRGGAVGITKIVFVGRLVEKKGVEYAIRALQILRKRGYNANLLIVGDGPLKNNLKRVCRHLNLEKEVIFLGAKNHDQIVKILKTAHLFVTPSITSKTGNEEGIPNVLKEAMAMGIPVVSTYHGGIPELVQNGTSGFLVAQRDPEAIAERLGFLIDHPKLWSKMGRNGRKFVEKNYDKQILIRQLIEICQHLIDK